MPALCSVCSLCLAFSDTARMSPVGTSWGPLPAISLTSPGPFSVLLRHLPSFSHGEGDVMCPM